MTRSDHRKAEELATEANLLMKQGITAKAEALYIQAGEVEAAALQAIDESKLRTRGIIVVSAASLYFKGADYIRAAQLADSYLNIQDLSASYKHQLQEIFSDSIRALNLVPDLKASTPVPKSGASSQSNVDPRYEPEAQDDQRNAKERLIPELASIFEEVIRSGPGTVPPEWFTVDLTMPQLLALFLLAQERTLRMGDLASTLGISLSTATGIIDRLIEKELVDRWNDPDDRRSVLCDVTEAGRELSGRLLAARRSWWEERLAALSTTDLNKVTDAMRLVLKAHQAQAPATEESQTSSNTARSRR